MEIDEIEQINTMSNARDQQQINADKALIESMKSLTMSEIDQEDAWTVIRTYFK